MNLDSNKLRTDILSLKKLNIKKYPKLIKLKDTETNFFHSIVRAELINTNNIIDVNDRWDRSIKNLNKGIYSKEYTEPRILSLLNMDHISILNNDDDKQSINRISGKSVGNLDTLDYDLFKSVLLNNNQYYDKSQIHLNAFGEGNRKSFRKHKKIYGHVRVGKLSNELLRVLGMTKKDDKETFPYWCKLKYGFNNKIKDNIKLKNEKGVIDYDNDNEYCTFIKSNFVEDKDLKLFGQ